MKNDIVSTVKSTGFFECGEIPPMQIRFYDEIRKICEGNLCRNYGKTWACPPAVGSVENCRRIALSYKSALLFNNKYELEDSFDFEGMATAHGDFKALCDRLYENVKDELSRFLILSNEGCNRCKKCTWPDSPCRFPEKLFPSLEGFGVNVSALASQAGIHYCNGENTVTYLGMILFDD